MPNLLIRDVDDALHRRLKARASMHRRSLAEEARELIRTGLAYRDEAGREHIVDVAARLFHEEHDLDLDLPSRTDELERPPPDFLEHL